MELTLLEMSRLVGARLTGGHPAAGRLPADPCTDSRSLKAGQVFWALRGENFDGHGYVRDCFSRGAAAAVVERGWASGNPGAGLLLPVADTRKALGVLARGYAERLPARRVALTGSTGKTTTKEMIGAVLAARAETLATAGNLNNDIGLPLTLFGLRRRHRFAVLELGSNHPGEIRSLARIARPQIAVITNVGPSHLEHFGSLENIFREKRSIVAGFAGRGTLVVNADDERLARLRSGRAYEVIGVGVAAGDLRAREVELDGEGRASFVAGRTRYQLGAPGRHNVHNALLALAVGRLCGVPAAAMQKALAAFTGSGRRLDMRRVNGFLLLDDCYNANPLSMEAALQTLRDLKVQGRRVAVLGDMLELGPGSPALHRDLGRLAARLGVDLLFATGAWGAEIAAGAAEGGLAVDRIRRVAEMDRLKEEVAGSLRTGDAVLVKASRGARLERVSEFLQEARRG